MPDSSIALRVAALRLLTRRDHSRAELKAKLAMQAESEDQLDAVLDTLQAERLLSDHRYASQRVVARAGRYGNARLRQELRQRGIGDDDIAVALPEAGDETERCRAIWAKKIRSTAAICRGAGKAEAVSAIPRLFRRGDTPGNAWSR